MKTYALDFESFYSKDCSITTYGPLGYFSHPEFDAYMVSIVGDDGYTFVGHPKDFDWSLLSGSTVVSHNAGFDHTLYLYGVSQNWWPKVEYAKWACTADMCAALGLPRSLKNASAVAFGLDVSKDTRDNMKGKRWEDMDEDFKKEVAEYALKDSELCLRLWLEMSDQWLEFEQAISELNRTVAQRGVPMNPESLQRARETVREQLFDAESCIPWNGEKPLLSRKAFDEECIKCGIEPPASLAKTDKDAQEWIEKHGKKYRWVAAVSNWRRINSLAKKLDAFDKGTMPDNRYYGNIKYYGGHTGRFSGSGGNLNLQNMPREEMFGVNMRHLIEAPKGKKLVVADLSQIEVRTLCWLAGDKDTLAEIEASDDIYEAFAIRFGVWSKDKGVLKKEDPELRHKVKCMVLGCFGPDTEVLTDRGWIPIVGVRDTDKLWDGQEWVTHKGVVNRGTKEVIQNHGIMATPDHEILTEHGWLEWSKVQQSEKDMKSALNTASLPLSVMNEGSKLPLGKKVLGGTPLLNVPVGGVELLTATTCSPDGLQDATFAPRKKRWLLRCRGMATKRLSRMILTDKDFSVGLVPYTTGATTQTTEATKTTEAGAYGYMNRGSRTGPRFSNISQLLKGGMSRILSWTGLTTTKGMNQTTYGSLPEKRTATTPEHHTKCKNESQTLSKKSEVFDIAYSGPRNRFTIRTNKGPLIVHNCGYGSGAATFAAITDMPMAEAEKSVDLYRRKLRKIPAYWRKLNNEVRTAHTASVPLTFDLPSGNVMNYGKLRQMRFKGKAQYVALMERNGRKQPMKLWGGVIAENMSQKLARDIFCHMMLEIERAGEHIILHVHDEVVVECDEERAEEVAAKLTKIMSTPPDWIPDIPLDSEGSILDRYQK